MLTQKQVLNWYKKHLKEIQLPWDSSHRQYRILDFNGRMHKIRKQISRPEQLLPFIERWPPQKVYYSLARWLNPKRMGPKKIVGPGYLIADNTLLSLDLGFDIDNEDLEEARLTTNKLLGTMSRMGFKPEYVAFSGSKGFHIVYKETKTSLPPNPKQRESFLSDLRKAFISKHLINTIGKESVDWPRSTNTRQIFKLPGSLDASTGATVQKLTNTQLQAKTDQIIKNHIPFIGTKERQGMLRNQLKTNPEQMTGTRRKPHTPRKEPRKAEGTCPTSPSTYTETFITNKVKGTKDRYVLFLHYEKNTKRYKKDLKRIKKAYNVGFAAVYQDDQEITILCPQTFQRRRLAKIIHATKSNNKNEMEKFGQQYLPVNTKTRLIRTHGTFKGRQSLAHTKFINKHAPCTPQKTEGRNELKFVIARFQHGPKKQKL